LSAALPIAIIVAFQEVPMIVERLDLPAPRVLPRAARLGAVLRRAWDWWWWSVQTYEADRHFLPRPDPPPNDWP
jgi:hypothetical protein